jgi:hypothetical protein
VVAKYQQTNARHQPNISASSTTLYRPTTRGFAMGLTKFLVAEQYVNTMLHHQDMEQRLDRAIKLLDQDNQVNIYGPVHRAYDELVDNLLGSDLFEHTLNWIYEHDFGKDQDLSFAEYFDSHQDSYENHRHD